MKIIDITINKSYGEGTIVGNVEIQYGEASYQTFTMKLTDQQVQEIVNGIVPYITQSISIDAPNVAELRAEANAKRAAYEAEKAAKQELETVEPF